jgi:hypothetical protein
MDIRHDDVEGRPAQLRLCQCDFGVFGRESYQYSTTDARSVSNYLIGIPGPKLDPGGFASGNWGGRYQNMRNIKAFLATVACEPLDRKLREGQRRGIVDPNIILTPEELTQWQRKEALRKQVIKVDDFPQDFGRAELVLEEKSTVAAKAA